MAHIASIIYALVMRKFSRIFCIFFVSTEKGIMKLTLSLAKLVASDPYLSPFTMCEIFTDDTGRLDVFHTFYKAHNLDLFVPSIYRYTINENTKHRFLKQFFL